MGKVVAVSLALVFLLAAPLLAQDDQGYQPFTPDQLDNLLAPVALYPDPLLAQVLVAAPFPDQIDEANRFVRDDPNPDDIDPQPWDVSVKAVAHYPEVLQMMADKLDWTTALGQAYVNQSTDVMASVQRLRAQAQQAGNLVTTPEMEVVDSGGAIELWPAQPQFIYVPVYDPAIVFFVRAPLFFRPRFVIGAWLNYDFDWRLDRVYYHGWLGGEGWERRCRPYIHVTNVYVNNTYRTVIVNRSVVRRPVHYWALNRYDDVHRNVRFDNVHPYGQRTYTAPPAPQRVETIHNKIIVRNVDTADPRLREYRGHVPGPQTQVLHPGPPAFTPNHDGFDPHDASRRGQMSRRYVQPPPGGAHPPVKRVEKKVERKHP